MNKIERARCIDQIDQHLTDMALDSVDRETHIGRALLEILALLKDIVMEEMEDKYQTTCPDANRFSGSKRR